MEGSVMDNKVNFISRTRKYIDEDGNEGVQTEIYKKVYNGKFFWRVWLEDLLHALDIISNSKQLDVVFYVLSNTNAESNLYISTMQKTAKETGVSYKTVATIFKKMQNVDMIVKQQNGVYKVKPTLLIKGDNFKKHRLIVEYEKIKSEKDEGE